MAAGKGLDGIDDISELKEGWDSYGALVPTERAKAIARIILGKPAWVVPMNDGGVQLEWHEAGYDLEIAIGPSDGGIDSLLFELIGRR